MRVTATIFCILFFSVSSYAAEQQATVSEELTTRIEQGAEVARDKINKLKKDLAAGTQAAQQKFDQILSSEEYTKLKNYVANIDKQTIANAKEKMSQEISSVLQLTEEQAQKLKPVMQDSMNQLGEMLTELKKSGLSAFGEYREKFEQFSSDLRSKLESTLNQNQLERFDQYRNEKLGKLDKGLLEV